MRILSLSINRALYLGLVLFPAFFAWGDLKAQSTSIDSLEQLLRLEKAASGQITLLHELSYESRKKDLAKSIQYAEKAREVALKNGLASDVARSYVNSGTAYYFQGRHEQALADYLEALKTYEHLRDSAGEVDVLNEIGTLEKKNGHLESSEKNLLRALELSKALADSGRVANSLNNLGHCYELKGDLELAMKLYRESTIIKEKQREWFAASFNYDNMANVLSRQQKFAEAENYYLKEIAIYNQLGDRMNYAIAVNNLGEMHQLKGDLGNARKCFHESLAISTEVGFKDLQHHIYTMLSANYEAENDFKRAFEYYRDAALLKDSIFNEQKSQQILDLRTRYETEKKESQIRLLQQENELKDLGLRQNRLFILGLVLALLSILIVGFLLLNRIKLKQNIDLETTRASLRESQLQAVIKSQEEERRRFAADLHDGLGQIISAVRMNLSREEVKKKTIDQALGLLDEMNLEIRNIAFNLMPHALMSESLEAALEQFVARINRTGKISAAVSAFNLGSDIPADQKIALYRICQEWVNNVIKYSGADAITIQLVQHPEELVVTIEDNGAGFDPDDLNRSQGNGWKNINSRVTLIKAQVEIDSAPGRKGTTLLLSVPVFMVLG